MSLEYRSSGLMPYTLALLFFLAASVAPAAPERPSPGRAESPEAERVVILANALESGSEALARDYARARNIPLSNIIALPLPSTEAISWRTFIDTLWSPLQERLVRDGWIDAIPSNVPDDIGRRKWAVNGSRIAHLVLCRGVPLRIDHNPALYREAPPLTRSEKFRLNNGSVDSELTLLAFPSYPINSLVPNPLFNHFGALSFEQSLVVKVARLDGPSFDDARSLFESALQAEKVGLNGRFLVDRGGPHPGGDQWLDAALPQLNALGFPGEVDREPATVPTTARVDQLAWYFGWYRQDIDGPFRLPGFRFAPGAIALHIHSFSAVTLRSPLQGWAAPFANRGAAGTFGNVAEPYLEFTHQPQILVAALARGLSLGDAAARAINALSWQAVVLGDPLYRPFARDVEAQWRDRAALPPAAAGALGLRRLALLEAANRTAEAEVALRELAQLPPSATLALALSRRREDAGDRAGAVRALEVLAKSRPEQASEWGAYAAAAESLAGLGAWRPATELWRALLPAALLSPADEQPWLKSAITAARRAGDDPQARLWERNLASPPSP